ncbi:MAG: hypothetical protein ABUL77_03295 [Bacteroidota bacterium]
MRRVIALFAVAGMAMQGGALADGTGGGPSPTPDPFVRVKGNELVLGGRPFRFVGANLAIMHGPDARAAADEVLAGAAADGVRVGRVWALGEGDRDAAPWLRDNFLFRAGPEGWINAAPEHLDRVIAAAGRAGIRLIITLANSWSDYGGVPRYLRWAGRMRDGVFGVGDRFYSDARARAAYRAHVTRLIGRTNQVTGIPYRDDPTILAWELMNESAALTAGGVTARRTWITEMAGLIHTGDPNHLVTPGVGGYRVERERQDWLAICRLPAVDFCDAHLYPDDLLQDRDGGMVDAVLDDHVRLARTLAGKPFVLGEFGLRGDATGLWRGQTRAAWVGRILDRLRADGAAGGLIWIYQSARGQDRVHGISVGAPGANATTDAIRAGIRQAAATLAAVVPGTAATADLNPLVGRTLDESPLMPLHAEFTGRSPSIPLVAVDRIGGGRLILTWNPPAFARADWESSGFYDGGAIEHAWGGETGWFEYEYEIVPPPPTTTLYGVPRGAAPPDAITVRARVSSEYPGSLSPPDGASLFEVSLDDIPLGRAVAPPDDGRGRWVTLRTAAAAACARSAGVAPGRHRLRFSVPAGPRAHGLALYGRAGKKATDDVAGTAPIELRFEWSAAVTRSPPSR